MLCRHNSELTCSGKGTHPRRWHCFLRRGQFIRGSVHTDACKCLQRVSCAAARKNNYGSTAGSKYLHVSPTGACQYSCHAISSIKAPEIWLKKRAPCYRVYHNVSIAVIARSITTPFFSASPIFISLNSSAEDFLTEGIAPLELFEGPCRLAWYN